MASEWPATNQHSISIGSPLSTSHPLEQHLFSRLQFSSKPVPDVNTQAGVDPNLSKCSKSGQMILTSLPNFGRCFSFFSQSLSSFSGACLHDCKFQ